MTVVNRDLFQEEIDTAGIPNEGVREDDGFVFFLPEATQQQRDQAAALLAAHNPNATTQAQKRASARDAILAGKDYLQKQLESGNPQNFQQIVGVLKPIIDSNTILTNMMTNQFSLKTASSGWVLDLNPAAQQTRGRYIEVAEQIIALLT